jgi:hypothetical protein
VVPLNGRVDQLCIMMQSTSLTQGMTAGMHTHCAGVQQTVMALCSPSHIPYNMALERFLTCCLRLLARLQEPPLGRRSAEQPLMAAPRAQAANQHIVDPEIIIIDWPQYLTFARGRQR